MLRAMPLQRSHWGKGGLLTKRQGGGINKTSEERCLGFGDESVSLRRVILNDTDL